MTAPAPTAMHAVPTPARGVPVSEAVPLQLADVYRQHVQFVWRSLAALGVPEAAREDVVHEVFLVVRAKLQRFDRRRSMRGWLYGIARNEALHYRRSFARRERRTQLAPVPERPAEPEEQLQWTEGARLVEAFLDELDDDKRMVFFMANIEGMTAPEIAAATGAKLATVYSRMRAARQRFDAYVAQLRDEGGTR